MSDSVSVSVGEVRAAMSRLLDQVEAELGEEVNLDADHYWNVENGERFDLSAVPELAACQLSDDVASVRAMLGGEIAPVVWHDLGHLIDVLQRFASLAMPAQSR